MSLVYRGINISQNEDYILSIMLALSTVQLQSEILYPHANVFFQRISLQSLETKYNFSEGQRHRVFIFSPQLFSPSVCPSRFFALLFSPTCQKNCYAYNPRLRTCRGHGLITCNRTCVNFAIPYPSFTLQVVLAHSHLKR